MPSRIDPNHPATGVAVSKAAARANWAAAKVEIEHGGFFEQAGIGALERPVADRLVGLSRRATSAHSMATVGLPSMSG